MSSNYGLILVVLTFVSGIIWLIDSLTAGKKRKAALAKLYEQSDKPAQEAIDAVTHEPVYLDYSKSFFPILLFIVVLRSFLYEPFQIPSASMKPTLTEGDFILVNKFNYGLRLPVTSEKVVEIGLPQRGDVAVFRAPHPPHDDYIKRVIGLPGDTVFYTPQKELYILPYCSSEIEKSQCPKKFKVMRTLASEADYIDRDPKNGSERATKKFVEKLGEEEHQIIINPNMSEPSKVKHYNIQKFPVPQGHYFVMGDNRDNSYDGRYWDYNSFVPEENLVGQAVSIWLHLDFGIKNKYFSWIPTGIDLGRVGAIK
ncbi:signal peptidase I [Aliikangiella sp. IMCC44359]|uniref:signal peptidase I n=1 Tax=Aliikangiella sp. IMCC44359 TaxID=3459125 RepID=UPI00403B1D15